MEINRLIQLAAVLAAIAVSSGYLPQILHSVRAAQVQHLKESQASKWGRPMMLPIAKGGARLKVERASPIRKLLFHFFSKSFEWYADHQQLARVSFFGVCNQSFE